MYFGDSIFWRNWLVFESVYVSDINNTAKPIMMKFNTITSLTTVSCHHPKKIVNNNPPLTF